MRRAHAKLHIHSLLGCWQFAVFLMHVTALRCYAASCLSSMDCCYCCVSQLHCWENCARGNTLRTHSAATQINLIACGQHSVVNSQSINSGELVWRGAKDAYPPRCVACAAGNVLRLARSLR